MTYAQTRATTVDLVADLLGVPADRIDPSASLEMLGVDSATTLVLAGQLSQHLGFEVNPVQVWGCSSIDVLAQRLASGSRSA